MAWNEQRARKRIAELRESAPSAAIAVKDLENFLGERRSMRDAVIASGRRFDEPIFAVGRNAAVVTHGVHVYARLMDHADYLMARDHQTPASDARAMQFLHAHYAACDELIAAFGIQRVDFHAGRLHAVVLTPVGDAFEGVRIETATAFAAAYRDMVHRMAVAKPDSPSTRVRIGIDSGPAVAINSGRREELEPLFIGSPANHAAKAAEGDTPGVYFGPGIRARRQMAKALGARGIGFADELDYLEERAALDRTIALDGWDRRASVRLDEAYAAFEKRRATETASPYAPAVFHFHHHEPPLRSIRYADHPPSNAIRMAMACIFADIAGFTAYVDEAMRMGRVAQAVSNLHVMRGEMNFVARDDFGGRKVRYIGDCLQAILAEGDTRNTDERTTVRKAVLAATGIYSSFELCRQLLPDADSLGIAVGIELGVTPLARLGLRGEASVRCVSSRSTCVSEEVQGRCVAGEIGIGADAYAAADVHVKRMFDNPSRKLRRTGHDATTALLIGAPALTGFASPAVATAPLRAYAP
jgi:hypothetical protein